MPLDKTAQGATHSSIRIEAVFAPPQSSAMNAIDGVVSDGRLNGPNPHLYDSVSGEGPQWLQLDLAGVYTINKVFTFYCVLISS